MAENFITHIRVNESRNVSNLDIPLSNTERKHLIITGKNGCGKTSLLLEIEKYIEALREADHTNIYHIKKYELEEKLLNSINKEERDEICQSINNYDTIVAFNKNVFLYFSFPHFIHNALKSGKFITSSFKAKREIQLNPVSGVKAIALEQMHRSDADAGINFLQFLVNKKADRSFARDDEEMDTVKKIDAWFDNFLFRLRRLYHDPELELKFDRDNYNFIIIPSKGIPFDFTTLSDGFSAILRIVSDIIMRMEGHKVDAYDMEGVVLLDEIETHLHVELQKEILPFLTDFFPRLQFIVTTHSPFVINSLHNAVICDLEKQSVVDDLSAYSYDALIESYFGVDKYSAEVKQKLAEYESLLLKSDITPDEKLHIKDLKKYLEKTPDYLSKELQSKLIDLELKSLA